MKKILMICGCLLLTLPLVAQQSKSVQVPVAIADTFRSHYPEGKLMRWNVTKEKVYVAYYYLYDVKSMAYFAPNGRWMKTKSYPLDLPVGVSRMIDQLYDNAIVGKIQKTETFGKPSTYVVILDTGPEVHKVLFSESGEVKGKKVKVKNSSAASPVNR